MSRPKDDADRLKKNRDDRRELLESIPSDLPDAFDELEETTSPAIHIHHHAPVAELPTRPLASPEPLPPPRAKQISESALEALPTTLETIPSSQRLWALVAVLIAAVAAYAISKGLWIPAAK